MHLNTIFSPLGLLHVRGGVSEEDRRIRCKSMSSPRPWRCFREPHCHGGIKSVFSTSVEVFLLTSTAGFLTSSLLHVRGGVS